MEFRVKYYKQGETPTFKKALTKDEESCFSRVRVIVEVYKYEKADIYQDSKLIATVYG